MYLILDTETTGTEPDARAVSIAWTVLNSDFEQMDSNYFILEPDGFDVPERVVKIHGIDSEMIKEKGISRDLVLRHLIGDLEHCEP